MAVDWGLAHRDLTNIEAIGVDELSRRRGQRYLTLVYQIDGHCKRLLWVGRERKAATLEGFFDWFGAARSAALYFVCSDMWKPYLKVVAERAGQAVQVLDRFHIMSHFSQAIDASANRRMNASWDSPVSRRSMLRIAAFASSVVASMPTVFPVTRPASASRSRTHVKTASCVSTSISRRVRDSVE